MYPSQCRVCCTLELIHTCLVVEWNVEMHKTTVFYTLPVEVVVIEVVNINKFSVPKREATSYWNTNKQHNYSETSCCLFRMAKCSAQSANDCFVFARHIPNLNSIRSTIGSQFHAALPSCFDGPVDQYKGRHALLLVAPSRVDVFGFPLSRKRSRSRSRVPR